MINYNPIGVI